MNDYTNFDVIIGSLYIFEDNVTVAKLESADIKEDFIRLKCVGSSWVYECDHSTFSYYWTRLEEK